MTPSEASPSPLPDIKDIADPDALMSVGEIVLLVVVILLALGALGVGGWFLYRFLTKDKGRPGTPKEIALKRLAELSQQIDVLTPNAFSLALSETLKDYLAARFDDPVRYETSEEFLWRLSQARANALPSSLREQVANFLSVSDEIKYGRPPDAEARKAPLLAQARSVIDIEPPPPPPQSGKKSPSRPRRRKKPPPTPRRRKIAS